MTDLVIIHSRDPDFFMLIGHILASAGFASTLATEGGIPSAGEAPTALAAIIDCSGDPDEAVAFCNSFARLGEPGRTPLLALVPAQRDRHVLQLLQAGIDEVFVRPVSPEHILIHLRAMRGAKGSPATGKGRVLLFGALEIDEGLRSIRAQHGSAQLSPIEFRLLKRLIEEPGLVRDRNDLIAAAWPTSLHVEDRTVDVHIGKLRRHLRRTMGQPLIRTVRSSGFVIEAADSFEKS